MLLLPEPFYRHGIAESTLDFPGGRHESSSLEESALRILQREARISPEHVLELKPISQEGWNVDSSFSSQKIYVLEAWIDDARSLKDESILIKEPANRSGVQGILSRLTCLQCRCALLEWMRVNKILY